MWRAVGGAGGWGVPVWSLERKLRTQRRAEQYSSINVVHYLSLFGSSLFAFLPLRGGLGEFSATEQQS